MGRMPVWSDPLPGVAPAAYQATTISTLAVTAFLEALEAEDRWDWNVAYRGYQAAAMADPSFVEADVALARAARLRLGGTLGES